MDKCHGALKEADDWLADLNVGPGRQRVRHFILRMRDGTDLAAVTLPTLRNVELTYPYFHDGGANTLGEAVDSKTRPPPPGLAWFKPMVDRFKRQPSRMASFLS